VRRRLGGRERGVDIEPRLTGEISGEGDASAECSCDGSRGWPLRARGEGERALGGAFDPKENAVKRDLTAA